MHPIFIIELLISGAGLLTIVMIAVILKGIWKKRFFGIAALYFIMVSLFFLGRPYWIDYRQDQKVEYLEMYLKEKYSEETWMMEKVPHREDDFASMNPYVIHVYFDSEPGVLYEYYVQNEQKISQTGYAKEVGFNHALIHLERE
ncbi:hypothetical protein PGH26_06985 [Sporosarcina jeotgali]|uniref:DUF3139 domain-containing protein n=1 Tax=Sporosarcina jeotgali TaxID=3020056 RepID=A0ABZ0KZ59_9BACL|nr:hypothetical protein [Sporosarcina sp. B2O-1]WOV85675.1 hypothetical protein PGH26_06985 [Sporosarcina sp. B2O-1]